MNIVVYKTTNLINNRIYIGVHKITTKKDTYIGNGVKSDKSAVYLKNKYLNMGVSIPQFLNAVLKYGYKNFRREILCTFSNYEDALNYERSIVTPEFVKRSDNYNTIVGGGSHEHTAEQRMKISSRMRINNPMHNPEVVQRAINNKKYHATVETKQLLSEKAKIWCNTKEMKELRSKNATGKNNSSYDPTVCLFHHKDGSNFIGTFFELQQFVGKSGSNLSLIKYNPKRSWFGWKCGHYHRVPVKN